MRCLVLAPLLASSVALAGPSKTIEGYTIAAESGALVVRKGGQRGLLERTTVIGASFKSVAFDKTTSTITLVAEDITCAGSTKYTWTLAQLDARLANDVALTLHLKKDHAGAATGFAKAIALDPKWRLPAYNLASARQLDGDQLAALAALAPWLASEPIATYVQVSTDPELAPLLARPELRAIRAKTPGSAKLTEKVLDIVDPFKVNAVFTSPDRGLVAFVKQDIRWVAPYIDLEIYEAKTGTLLASSAILRPDDLEQVTGKPTAAGKKRTADRLAKLQTLLVELGFGSAKLERGTQTDADDRIKLAFPKAKLGVVVKDMIANALRGNTQVGSVKPVDGRVLDSAFVEGADTVVIVTHRHSAEGCDGGPETGLSVLPIKK